MDVRHRPGRLNPVADGISRKFVNLPTEPGDGHEWTVSQDWEERTGLEHDIFQVADQSTYASMKLRFVGEKVFLSIIDALFELDHGKSVRERKRAKHRAHGYMIEGSKLWRVGDSKSVRARARVECIPRAEAAAMAWEVHRANGHFHRDNVKITLMDRVCSPGLDMSITKAIMGCGRCKGFGATHIHSLLEPITRRHPFELIVTDTLSMPKGKGGYNKLGLYVDVYSQYVSANKLKKAATGRTSCASFSNLCDIFTEPETLMADGGPEFNNGEMRALCKDRGVELRIVPAYSPWVNGLLEGMNAKLLAILKRLCAPDLGEDDYDKMAMEDIPANWPDHLDAAIRALNRRILPNLKYSPSELLLGLVVNTVRTPVESSITAISEEDVELQMAYVSQQQLDGYSEMVDHAYRRKKAFDHRVLSKAPKEVIFRAGQLVQVYRSDLDFTFKNERKMEPRWSAPWRVTSRDRNSYKIETLEGLPIGGLFSSRRLRQFIPREGTALEIAQEAIERKIRTLEDAADRIGGDTSGVVADALPSGHVLANNVDFSG